MTRIQLKHRTRLTEKHQAALTHWRDRSANEFRRELREIVSDLESLALQADVSSVDLKERARTWSCVAAAYCDLGAASQAAAARAKAEQLTGLADTPSEWSGAFGLLEDAYQKAIHEGKVPPARHELLDTVLAQLGPEVLQGSRSVQDLHAQRSRLADLLRSMSHVITDASEGGPPLPPGSRAQQVWSACGKLKLALFEELNRPHLGNEEWTTGFSLLWRLSRAGTAFYKAHRDSQAILQQEGDVLRPLALEIRAFILRKHVAVCTPAWPASPAVQNANTVYFSGAARTGDLLTTVCRARNMVVLDSSGATDPDLAFWDVLRQSSVAVFDFDSGSASVAYQLGAALALGRNVVVTTNKDGELPFDVDVRPVRFTGNSNDEPRLGEALDSAAYGLQRGGAGTSVGATLAHIRERLSGSSHFLITQTLKRSHDSELSRDAVASRREVESLVGAAQSSSLQVLFPAWPVSYPNPASRRCFHVTPFSPKWASQTMSLLAVESERAGVQYVRGDGVLDPAIIRSIWDNICMASHIVVDLTGGNANVALELGMARALGRDVLLITQDAGSALAELAKVRTHRYSIDTEDGRSSLRTLAARFFEQRPSRC